MELSKMAGMTLIACLALAAGRQSRPSDDRTTTSAAGLPKLRWEFDTGG